MFSKIKKHLDYPVNSGQVLCCFIRVLAYLKKKFLKRGYMEPLYPTQSLSTPIISFMCCHWGKKLPTKRMYVLSICLELYRTETNILTDNKIYCLVPKVLLSHSLTKKLWVLLLKLEWLVQTSCIQVIILIHRRGNYVYHHQLINHCLIQ